MNLVLFLHPRAMADEDIDQAMATIQASTKHPVTSGRDHFRQHAGRAGGWSGWQRRVVQDAQLLIVPGDRVGRATGQILELALARKLPIVVSQPDGAGPYARVLSVVCVDKKDWIAGYKVITGRHE